MDQLIRDSKFTELYSTVVVPEGFSVYEKEETEDIAEAVKEIVEKLSDAERRKLENRIIVNAFQSYDSGNTFWRRKFEPRINEILKEQKTIIYGFQEDEKNLQLVHKFLNISRKPSMKSWGQDTYEAEPVLMVAQQNAKYFKHHIKATELYEELKFYVNLNYVSLDNGHTFKETVATLENYADRVTEFQLFVAGHKGNDQAIAAKSRALFETNEEGSFKDAIGIELEPYNKLQQLLEAVAPIQLLLNQIDCLTNVKTISYQLEKEIKEYLNFKGYISLSNTAPAPTLPVAGTAELMEA
ncbi:unnamed protein product [Sphagnum balticum]